MQGMNLTAAPLTATQDAKNEQIMEEIDLRDDLHDV